MPAKAHSILRAWQEQSPDDRQPTCYDARNPAMPWMQAAELGFDDAEDRETARTWCELGAPAVSLGRIAAKAAGTPRPDPEAEEALANSTKTILQQLADALAPHPKKFR